jgi:type III pantothenate kinase
MNIAIDAGNTYAKIGWFDGDRMIRYQSRLSWSELIAETQRSSPERVIFSSVGRNLNDFTTALQRDDISVIDLTPNTPLPIRKNYDTPQTLGADRIASAVGAQWLYPNEDVLIVDMGTCITYDYLDKSGSFEGGGISPGVKMRFAALHTFTERLPHLEPVYKAELIGKSTKGAIESGVMNGMLMEIEGIIEQYRHISAHLRVVVCGGDVPLFESRLKPTIFVVPELVLIGLNRILRYNVAL